MKNKKLIPEIRFPEFSGEWVEKRLGEVANIKKGVQLNRLNMIENGQYMVINGGIEASGYINDFNSEENTITISEGGNSCGYINLIPSKFWCGGHCYKLENIKTNKHFLYFILKKEEIKIMRLRVGSGLPNIQKKDLIKYKVSLPLTLNEQNKIADFLSSVDEKIEIISKKIEELKKYKKGMLQKLLDVKCNNGKCEPELRFKGFSGDWIEKRLGEILKERKEYSTKNNNNIHLTLSKDGIFPKTEQFNRDFLVTNKNKKYKITYLNDICYNPANLKFGVIGRNKYGKGIFSPIYITFKIKNANPIFIENIVTSKNFINKALKYQEGTVYERMAVKPEDLLKLTIFIPPTLAEQQKIANFLSSIDEKIELNEKKLEKLKAYKKGLLQKMFV